MNVVKVKRTEKNLNGIISERTMMIKESVWDRIRKENHPNLRWEILSSSSEKPKEKQLMPALNSIEGAELVEYSNYSLIELKGAAKNAGITGYAILGKAKLIEKLKANDNSNSN